MGLYYENLDVRTRQLMRDEMDLDISQNKLTISPYLSGQGVRDYPQLLRQAIESGTDDSLAAALGEQRRLPRIALAVERCNRLEAIGYAPCIADLGGHLHGASHESGGPLGIRSQKPRVTNLDPGTGGEVLVPQLLVHRQGALVEPARLSVITGM